MKYYDEIPMFSFEERETALKGDTNTFLKKELQRIKIRKMALEEI